MNLKLLGEVTSVIMLKSKLMAIPEARDSSRCSRASEGYAAIAEHQRENNKRTAIVVNAAPIGPSSDSLTVTGKIARSLEKGIEEINSISVLFC